MLLRALAILLDEALAGSRPLPLILTEETAFLEEFARRHNNLLQISTPYY